jgi:hypothetical protein
VSKSAELFPGIISIANIEISPKGGTIDVMKFLIGTYSPKGTSFLLAYMDSSIPSIGEIYFVTLYTSRILSVDSKHPAIIDAFASRDNSSR